MLLFVNAGFRPNSHFSIDLIMMETTVVNNCLFVVISILISLFRRSPEDAKNMYRRWCHAKHERAMMRAKLRKNIEHMKSLLP